SHFPARELKDPSCNQRRTRQEGNGTAEDFPTHRRRCERDTERVNSHPSRHPDGEVAGCHHGQGSGRAFLFQKRGQRGRQHHRHHHRQPHELEACDRSSPALAWHSHPHHGHPPTSGHFHFAAHRATEINCGRHAGDERKDTCRDKFSPRRAGNALSWFSSSRMQ